MEMQRTRISIAIFKKRTKVSDFKTYYGTMCSQHTCGIGISKNKQIKMNQNKEPRQKSVLIQSSEFLQRHQSNPMKGKSSTNDAGIIRYPYGRNKPHPLPHSTYKNQFKMCHKPKQKTITIKKNTDIQTLS